MPGFHKPLKRYSRVLTATGTGQEYPIKGMAEVDV
jgi:hypothetical protein